MLHEDKFKSVCFNPLQSQWKIRKKISWVTVSAVSLKKIQIHIEYRWKENLTSGLHYYLFKITGSSTSYSYLIWLKTHSFTKFLQKSYLMRIWELSKTELSLNCGSHKLSADQSKDSRLRLIQWKEVMGTSKHFTILRCS